MASYNDITGDPLVSRPGLSDEGKKNWDNIFPPKKKERYVPPPLPAELASTKPAANKLVEHWTEADEKRLEVIGQNGNIGYEGTDIEGVSSGMPQTNTSSKNS
jgi:hypothetical protein